MIVDYGSPFGQKWYEHHRLVVTSLIWLVCGVVLKVSDRKKQRILNIILVFLDKNIAMY